MSGHALTFGETPTSDDKTFATLAHLSIYVSHVLGPLVVWFIFKDKSAFVKFHAMQALLFQLVILVLTTMIGALAAITCGIGALLYLLLLPLLVVPLWGAWRAHEGDWGGFPGLSAFGR